jgi:hypothetical protein
MPIRLDRAKPKRWEKLKSGFLRAPAYLTRVGVFEYDVYDAATQSYTKRAEYRPAEEVFHPDSLASFEMLPVVVEHPPERLIDSTTVAKYQKGSLSENLSRDGDKLAGVVMVTHGDAVADIESGKRTQISLGYTCDLRPESGAYQGKPYTHVQVNIRGNHEALTKEGRMGSDIGIRLDSADAIAVDLTEETTPHSGTTRSDSMEKVLINGVWFEVPAQAAQALKVERDAVTKNDSAVTEKLKALEADALKEKARADAAEAKATVAEKARNDAADPARLDKLVAERMSLCEQARAVLGAEVKLDGKDAKSIKLDVLKKLDPDATFDGKSDEYVNAYYESSVRLATRTDSTESAVVRMRAAAGNAGGTVTGAEKAFAEMQKRTEEAYAKPIGYTLKQ